MAATDTESMHENMTRLRMKMVQQKLANEREKLERPESASTNNDDSNAKLQRAMLRRQELLDRIRQEQMVEEQRPRTYSPRRHRSPTPLPPPSRRSLPDLRRTYHFNWIGTPRDMSQSKHIIEHQFRPAQPLTQRTYVLPPIQNPPPPPPPPQVTTIQAPAPQIIQAPSPPQHVIQQVPNVTYVDGGVVKVKDHMFNKADFMDMMMLQNAQMHHMVMQQMMLQQLPGGGSWKLPTAQVPLAPVVEPAVRPAPMVASAPAPVVHHYQPAAPLEIRAPPGRVLRRNPVKVNNQPIVVRTDVVRNTFSFSEPTFHPRNSLCIVKSVWTGCQTIKKIGQNKNNRPSSVFLFGIILKEIVAALHRIYLNPNGNIYPVLGDVIGSGAHDFTQLVGEQGRVADQDRIRMYQTLQYIMENLIYHITEIMPRTGVLGTHKKAAVFEMIKNGKRFPDGYFWQIELDRLQFNNNGRTVNVNDRAAFLLMVGMFISRSLITTLLMKPVDYGLSTDALSDVAERNLKVLSTIMLFLVRRVSTPREAPMMPMPGEVVRYVFTDDEFRNVHLRLRRSYEYCENLLREWGAEYIKRLRDAVTKTTK